MINSSLSQEVNQSKERNKQAKIKVSSFWTDKGIKEYGLV